MPDVNMKHCGSRHACRRSCTSGAPQRSPLALRSHRWFRNRRTLWGQRTVDCRGGGVEAGRRTDNAELTTRNLFGYIWNSDENPWKIKFLQPRIKFLLNPFQTERNWSVCSFYTLTYIWGKDRATKGMNSPGKFSPNYFGQRWIPGTRQNTIYKKIYVWQDTP